MQNYLHRLKKARDDCEEIEHQCQDIINHGYTPDPKGFRHQVKIYFYFENVSIYLYINGKFVFKSCFYVNIYYIFSWILYIVS